MKPRHRRDSRSLEQQLRDQVAKPSPQPFGELRHELFDSAAERMRCFVCEGRCALWSGNQATMCEQCEGTGMLRVVDRG
jgi:hypothetical protein